MNVLHFINNLNREGAQIMVGNLVTAGDRSQFKYSVCVRQPGGSLVAELREQGVNVVEPARYLGFRSTSQSVNFLKQVCSDNQIHIIHAHMADASFLGWLVARKLNLPLVITHHGHDILLKCNPLCRLVYYFLLNLAVRYAAINIAVSTSVAERVYKLLGLNQRSVQVIGNGVRIPDESQLLGKRVRAEAANPSLRLVNVGRLVPLKGQCDLIRAVSRLVDDFPDIRLYIVGGGDMARELKQLAEDENIGRHVELTGAVDDVDAYLSKADIYVSCSRAEGMPVSVMEAMAWRLPVIASDIPGNKNLVMPGKTGFLYELDNTDDLVKEITRVAGNTELARSVGDRAGAMVTQEYSVDVCVQRHEKLYRSILA